MSRRRLQGALGAMWLLDGLLALQPFMFTRGFADQVIAPAGQGQPPFVAAPIGWAAHLIAAQPAAWDGVFAGGQANLQTGAPGAAVLYAVLAISAWPGRDRTLWVRGAWAAVWCGGGLLGLLAGQSGGPGLLALELAVGLGALWRPTALAAEAIGIATAAAFWVFGQDFGQLTSGHATDPNSAPLLVLMGLLVFGTWTSAMRRSTMPGRGAVRSM